MEKEKPRKSETKQQDSRITKVRSLSDCTSGSSLRIRTLLYLVSLRRLTRTSERDSDGADCRAEKASEKEDAYRSGGVRKTVALADSGTSDVGKFSFSPAKEERWTHFREKTIKRRGNDRAMVKACSC